MSKLFQWLSLLVPAALVFPFVGCTKEQAPSQPVAVEKEVVEEVEVPEVSPSDVSEGLAELNDADRAAALAQKVCPVSGEALGSMGTPIKVTVKGRDVFLCCEGCREKLEANPDEYLAKLDAK